MLKVRNSQLQALADHDMQEFREVTIALLERKFPDKLKHLPEGYTHRLVSTALAACVDNGFEQQGASIEFAEALVKNDVHPMNAAAMGAKAQVVLREFRSRAAFLKLQALAASVAKPVAAGDGSGETAEPIQE